MSEYKAPQAASAWIETAASVLPSSANAPQSLTTAKQSDQLFYDAKLSRSLPHINLTKTFASLVLSPAMHDRYLVFMRKNFTLPALFYRLGSILFFAPLFMGRSSLQVAFVVISAAECITIMCVMSLFSLDVMRLLLPNHEF